MYDELIKRLREADEKSMCGECGLNLHTGATKKGVLFAEAADAIAELQGWNNTLSDSVAMLTKQIAELSKRVPKAPHGRLIDADELDAYLKTAAIMADGEAKEAYIDARAEARTMAVIIPAEEGET